MAQHFPYDAACKAFFGEEAVFRPLLTDFGILRPEDAARIVAMRLISPNMETEEPARRMADMIWSVAFPQGDLHVLVEFQRSRDGAMASRMGEYSFLHLTRESAKGRGPAPVILPIVIYLGERPWNCPLRSHDLQASAPAALPVSPYGGGYYLLDAHRLPQELLNRAGPAAFLFRLERAGSYMEGYDAAEKLRVDCPGPQSGRLRRIAMNMLHLYNGTGEWPDGPLTPLSEEDMTVMLTHMMKGQAELNRRLKAEGEAIGVAIGKAEGAALGLKKQLAGLLALVAQRFGAVPEHWRQIINAISNPDAVNGLLLDTYGCATAEEFESRLQAAAKS